MPEMTSTAADARITPGCPGLWTDDEGAARGRIVARVHAQTAAAIGMQIGHVGPKGPTLVAECAVISVPDAQRGQRVKALAVLQPGMVGDAACVLALQGFAKAGIAPGKTPPAVAFKASLSRTDTVKLQRFKSRSGGGCMPIPSGPATPADVLPSTHPLARR